MYKQCDGNQKFSANTYTGPPNFLYPDLNSVWS